MTPRKFEPIPVAASTVRSVGITPWRLAIWAKAETEPWRRNNLLRAAIAMIEDEIHV